MQTLDLMEDIEHLLEQDGPFSNRHRSTTIEGENFLISERYEVREVLGKGAYGNNPYFLFNIVQVLLCLRLIEKQEQMLPLKRM
jgi:hypothetical protein